MEILFFGNSRSPAIDFTLDPNEGLKIHSRESYCLNYSGIEDTLSWKDFFLRVEPELFQTVKLNLFVNEASLRDVLFESKQILFDLTATTSERTFLDQYLSEIHDAHASGVHNFPALIPQAWVSWLHYRPDDSERLKALRRQPFRVDFIAFYEGRKLVIEIDGWSHISDNYLSIDRNGHPAEESSLVKYTAHLKKDRWLRRQGWQVHRFSTIEVEQEGAVSLLSEIGVNPIPF